MSYGHVGGSMIRKVKANNYTAILPMLHLLKEVNRVHRNGLDID